MSLHVSVVDFLNITLPRSMSQHNTSSISLKFVLKSELNYISLLGAVVTKQTATKQPQGCLVTSSLLGYHRVA